MLAIRTCRMRDGLQLYGVVLRVMVRWDTSRKSVYPACLKAAAETDLISITNDNMTQFWRHLYVFTHSYDLSRKFRFSL